MSKFKETLCPRNVIFMLCFRFFNGVAFAMRSSSIFDSYIHMQFKDNTSVGMMSSCSGIASLLTAPLAGFFCDKMKSKRSKILRICACFSILCIALNLTAVRLDSFYLLLCSSFLWSTWHEFVYITTDSLYTDSLPQGLRSEYFMYRRIVSTLASSLGPFITFLLFVYMGNKWNIDILHFVLQIGVLLCIPQIITLWNWEDIDISLGDYDEEKNDSSQTEQNFIPDPSTHDNTSIINGSEEKKDDIILNINNKKSFHLKTPPFRRFLCFTSNEIPWIIFISNTITFAGAGMTVKFFPLFLKKDYNFGPRDICLLSSVYTIVIAIATYVVQRFSLRIGRAQASLLFTFIGICGLFLLANVYSLPVVIIIYILRGAFQNASNPLDRSIMMDYVSITNIGKWIALESLISISWAASALVGGYIADKKEYRFTFYITAMIYLLAYFVYLPCLWLVPKVENFEDEKSKKKEI